MARTLPTVRDRTLDLNRPGAALIDVDSPAWRQWLAADDTRSFRFEHPAGSFTARRETISGGRYWYGYRKRAGKLRKVYLGRAEQLTIAQLRAAAATLSGGHDDATDASRPAALSHEQTLLLTTKLIAPPIRTRRVARRRLAERLHAALEHPLTLVVAPAGSGKTTLVSEWTQSLAQPVAWVSLDAGDNDPRRFWSYVLAALHRALPAIDPQALRLASPAPEAVAAALAQTLSRADAPVVLVLDDYHAIDAAPIHAALTALLTHVLPRVHLLLISRIEPPLPLPRLRARGQLIEIRGDDLRFTADEAAAFLADVMALPLAAAEVQTLTERTEGWITGLHLAALALSSGERPAPALFDGSHPYLLDYLADEILLRQPASIQRFLLRTSILERLSAPLCAAVLDEASPPDAGAQQLLAAIERAHLFLVPLDAERRWYRYHGLFADFLRARLRETMPDLIPTLHRRASGWYAAEGLVAPAIDHALAGGDWERAAELIGAAAQALIVRGEVATLLRWLEALPAAVMQRNVGLNLLHAWSLVVTSHVDGLAARIALLEQSLGPQAEAALLGEVAALHSAMAAMRGDFLQATSWAQPALDQLPPASIYRGVLALVLGAAQEWQGTLDAAAQSYIDAAAAARSSGNPMVDVTASCSLALIQWSQGRLAAAAETYHAVLSRTTADGAPLPLASMAYAGLSDLLYEWNDLAGAERYAGETIALAQQLGNSEIMLQGYCTAARVQLAADDLDRAAATLAVAAPLAQRMIVWAGTVFHADQIRLWIRQGALARAAEWARSSDLRLDRPLQPFREPEYLALVRVALAQGAFEHARRWIERLRPPAEATGRWSMVVELLVLGALLADAEGDTTTAVALLERALTLAAAERPIRVFLDSGPPIAQLLAKIEAMQRRRPTLSPSAAVYLAALLAAAPSMPPSAPGLAARPQLFEPLSSREHEVLQLLAQGLATAAIAARLVIAPSTVKRHLLSIYRKLDVHSRVEALARARAFELVP